MRGNYLELIDNILGASPENILESQRQANTSARYDTQPSPHVTDTYIHLQYVAEVTEYLHLHGSIVKTFSSHGSCGKISFNFRKDILTSNCTSEG